MPSENRPEPTTILLVPRCRCICGCTHDAETDDGLCQICGILAFAFLDEQHGVPLPTPPEEPPSQQVPEEMIEKASEDIL